MSFSVPGIILERQTLTLDAANPVSHTYSALTPSSRKANAVMINLPSANGAFLAADTIVITVDGTTPNATDGTLNGFNISQEKTLFFCGLPSIKARLRAASTFVGVVEIYLMYVSACHN